MFDPTMPVATIKRIIRILIRTDMATIYPEPEPETAALAAEIKSYADWISAHIPYFNRLSVTEKERFIRRVFYFRQRKQFHFHGVEPRPEIPVLISAAAVQLTFGLRRYQLPYFRHIHILADAYPLQDHQGLFIGHVDRQQICLSWKHFLEGYADATDNVNVAIHEMAHALQFENFIPQKTWTGNSEQILNVLCRPQARHFFWRVWAVRLICAIMPTPMPASSGQ